MSSKILTSDEGVFGKGTRVKFKWNTPVSTPTADGVMGVMVVDKDSRGVIVSVFPYFEIRLDSGESIKLHKSISLDHELEIIPCRAQLRLVV